VTVGRTGFQLSNPKTILDWRDENLEVIEATLNGKPNFHVVHYERDTETNGWGEAHEVQFPYLLDALKYVVTFVENIEK
jgi:hypothetical protein